MIGDREHVCKDEEEVERAIKNRRKIIYAYEDIDVKERTVRKIQKNRIIVIGVKRGNGRDK